MNALRDREREISDYREERTGYREQRPSYREQESGGREISLGTGTILGIFFALALMCAVFFGFGYSMGRKSAQTASALPAANASAGIFGSFKPSAGNPLGSSYLQKKEAARAAPDSQADSSVDQSASAAETSQRAVATRKQDAADAHIVGDPVPSADSVPVVVKPLAKTSNLAMPSAAVATVMPATTPNGTAMVQVAAVSHQEDADLLLSALKRRGYEVFVRQEAQDRLLHVQLGPFASRKEADIMRQRLLSDGYNAIVK